MIVFSGDCEAESIGWVSAWPASSVQKTSFWRRFLLIEYQYLPRQARGKLEENSLKTDTFLQDVPPPADYQSPGAYPGQVRKGL